MLRAAGHTIEEATPWKWRTRGIPPRVAVWIAELPRAKHAGLTAAYMTLSDSAHGRDDPKTLSSDTGVSKKTAAEKLQKVAGSVAEHWRTIILDRKLAFSDVLQLLDMERKWLEQQAELRDDPHLMHAAHDVARTIESIRRMI